MPEAAPLVAIVDDEPEMRKALRRLLTLEKYAVEEYECGEDFVASLGSHVPDCLLLDLHMPGSGGLAVLRAIQARGELFPAIVITAYDEPGTAERVRASGACAYFRKPVERNDLLPAIDAAISANQQKRQASR